MIKLVAFDWNGTILADTVPCWEGAVKELEAAGAKPISLLRFKETFTIPYIKSLVMNGVDRRHVLKNGRKFAKAFHEYYEPRAAHCRTRTGVRETLAWLKKYGIRSVIFSNHTIVGIETQLKRLRIGHHMDIVLANNTQDGALHLKNKGQKLHEYVKKRALEPDEVIVVGDTEEEIEIARKYGYASVALTGGYSTVARLKEHKPDFLIHNLGEVAGIIRKINGES